MPRKTTRKTTPKDDAPDTTEVTTEVTKPTTNPADALLVLMEQVQEQAARTQAAALALVEDREAVKAELRPVVMDELREEFDKRLAEHKRSTEARVNDYERRNAMVLNAGAKRVSDGLDLIQQMPLPPDLDSLGPLPEPVVWFFTSYRLFIERKRREFSVVGSAMAPYLRD